MNTLNDWLEELEWTPTTSTGRRKAIGRACSRVLVLYGRDRVMDPKAIVDECEEVIPGRRGIRRLLEGSSVARSYLAEEWPFDQEELGAWTPDFVAGLELSGFIRPWRGAYRIRPVGSRPWLEDDLTELPCAGRLAGPWPAHRMGRKRKCDKDRHMLLEDFWVGRSKITNGPGVLAGVLCGSKILKLDGVRWLIVPPKNRELLSQWGVNYQERQCVGGRKELKVSPFWGAVVSRLMPPASQKAMTTVHNPAQCPLLPAVCFKAFCGGRWCTRTICGKALPYCVGRSALHHRGILTGGLTRRAFTEFGMTFVHPWMRDEMLRVASLGCTECTHIRGEIKSK